MSKDNKPVQTQEIIKEKTIIHIVEAPKDASKRKLFIALAVCLCLSLTGYALSVPSFTDYSPPDYLYLNWGDYVYGTGDNMAMNNAPSGNPRETAAYPYRTLFYGRTGAAENTTRMYVVYSKTPVTNRFTFQYMGSDKSGSNGRIRASVGKIFVNHSSAEYGDEILIHGPFGNGLDAATGTVLGGLPYMNFNANVSGAGTQGGEYYFSFDFMYDCASEHQQGANDLNMNGLTSISSVPYQYIIHCKDHIGYTGGGGGGDSSGGSSGGSGGTGSNGGKKWGNGSQGGGIDWGNGGKPTINGGGSGEYNSNRPDWNYESQYDEKDFEYSYPEYSYSEYSSPSNWKDKIESGRESPDKYPWEIDSNIPDLQFDIPIPEFTGQGDGDTGYSGGTLPTLPIPPLDKIEFNFTIPKSPVDTDKIQIIGIQPEMYFNNTWPPKPPS